MIQELLVCQVSWLSLVMRASQAVVAQLDLGARWLILDHSASLVLLETLDKDLEMTLDHLEILVRYWHYYW